MPAPSSQAPHTISGFRRFAEGTAHALGSPWAFATAVAAVLVWAATGPAFHFSETWQMVINTGTTIVTFLMVFLLQNTQTRETRALHLKLDELIRSVKDARTGLVGLEQLPDEDLNKLAGELNRIADHERSAEKKGDRGR
ncbi:MAG TPA: low affinity iron permease family protein [Gemmatimonadales bacterium]|jgi:low affinity Fe/Cu permease|nr:low affinity iron permease family protein [Gemmatimonadales bacterium]